MQCRKFAEVAVFLTTVAGLFGQTNVFPTTGSVGIGTTTPSDQLEISSAEDAQITITADSDNSGETDNPTLFLQQDGGLVGGIFGINGSTDQLFDDAIANATFIQTQGGSSGRPFQIATGGYSTGSIESTARVTVLPNGKVGIGTNSPTELLELKGGNIDLDNGTLFFRNSASNAYGIGYGTEGGENLTLFADSKIDFTESDSDSIVVRMDLNASRVGINTTNLTHTLSVNGTIRAKEIIVDTGWADYVFAEDYVLPPLSEVEAHIATQGHLPNIPSAAEVAANGVSLGEMQSLLLAKIEELTLHTIRQEKELRRLAAENRELIHKK